MRKPLSINVFTQYSMSHSHPGLWRLDEAHGNREYTDVASWIELARAAEAATFDAIFFADGLGAGGYFDGDLDRPLIEGQYMRMDPSVLIAALSTVTEHLGFVMTSAMIQDHPFHFARRMSTLDHITDGRLGWNVVTSFNPGAWMNFGIDPDFPHDERYRWADEYMDVVYKLWEGSWERDAPVHDIASGVWIDPAKVHEIDHVSEHYSVKGPHMVEPSPQGTPVIFQAGASPAGKAFAARHAEMQFIGSGSPSKAKAFVEEVRAQASGLGRDGGAMRFAPSMQFVVGSTEEEARRRADELLEHLSMPGVASKMNSQLGIDMSTIDPDTPVTEITTNGIQSFVDSMLDLFPDGRVPTIGEAMQERTRKSLVAGTPEQIADRLEQLQDAGVDGVLVSMVTRPGSLLEFADHVAPVLKDRGLMRREYAPGTLRQKLFGRGDLLPDSHPAARFRRAR